VVSWITNGGPKKTKKINQAWRTTPKWTKAALERAKEHYAPQIRIDPALIERFGRMMRENLSNGSVPFRKAYLQSLIASIEVDDDVVRIRGSRDLLEKAVLASQTGQSWCSQMSTGWRATVDEDGHYSFAVPL
jgi:site-specific DNA recombinase